MKVDRIRIEKRPKTLCNLSYGARVTCDSCREKASIIYEGNEYFCIAHVFETRFLSEMSDCGYNTSFQWGMSIKRESEESNEETDAVGDNVANCSGLGVGIKDTEASDPVGVDSEADSNTFRNSLPTQEPPTETDEIVGECCNC